MYFVNRLIITRIESYFFPEIGFLDYSKSVIKSYKIDIYSTSTTGRGWISLYSLYRDTLLFSIEVITLNYVLDLLSGNLGVVVLSEALEGLLDSLVAIRRYTIDSTNELFSSFLSRD